MERDPRTPPVGTVLEREYRGKLYKVTVIKEGFQYNGAIYTGISSAAFAITQNSVNGWAFFGLNKKVPTGAYKARQGKQVWRKPEKKPKAPKVKVQAKAGPVVITPEVAIPLATATNGHVKTKAWGTSMEGRPIGKRAKVEMSVLAAIQNNGTLGATDYEIEVITGLTHQSASARRRGLVLRGLVVAKSDAKRRPGNSGLFSTVWIAK